jgi:hypothetical protein
MTGIVDFRNLLIDENGDAITSSNPLPTTGGGGGGGAGVFGPYALNDFENGATLYLGKVKSDGTWLLQKYDQAIGSMRYANESNNASVTTYASAWSNKSTLTYNEFQVLTGV